MKLDWHNYAEGFAVWVFADHASACSGRLAFVDS
jgi:hypothetical protein